MKKVLKYGMVGGGPGAFIGEAHRKAIALDGQAVLTAGCFSRDFEATLRTGEECGVERDRLYKDYREMAERESSRDDGIDFVVITTPNNSHYEICKAFLERGIAVSCEKPLSVSAEEAEGLADLVKEKNIPFMVTYIYSGHVTAMEIRELIRSGAIGEIRTVMGEYPQGWLAFEDISGNKQGEWRTDPSRSGRTNALGDIGTHIENTVFRMTGLKIKKLLSRMDVVVPGRVLDDNSFVLLEYENGASGCYWASQIAIGHDNGLRIRIYGSKGSIKWYQEEPEKFHIAGEDGVFREIHRGCSSIHQTPARYQRLPGGHPEGWFEAMANLYRNFMEHLKAWKDGTFTEEILDYPTIEDGLDGIQFLEACLKSSEQGNVWVEL